MTAPRDLCPDDATELQTSTSTSTPRENGRSNAVSIFLPQLSDVCLNSIWSDVTQTKVAKLWKQVNLQNHGMTLTCREFIHRENIALPLSRMRTKRVMMALVSCGPNRSFRRFVASVLPGDLLRQRSQNHLLHLHCPLHFRRRDLLHAVLRLEAQLPAGQKRPTRVLIHPANSCANDTVD